MNQAETASGAVPVSSTKPNKAEQNHQLLLFVIIFLIALTARIVKLILDPVIMRDSVLYLGLSEIWQRTGEYSQTIINDAIIPPLPLFAIKEVMACGFSSQIAGRSLSLFLGSIIPVLGFIIAVKLFKDKVIALICAAVFILHPNLVSYSIHPLRENYYLFFAGIAIIEIINAVKNRNITDWCLVGIFASFAMFCRYEALEFTIICPLILLFSCLKKRISAKKVIRSLAAFFVGYAVTFTILLSMIDFDLSFVKKISHYGQEMVPENVFDNIVYDNPQSDQ